MSDYIMNRGDGRITVRYLAPCGCVFEHGNLFIADNGDGTRGDAMDQAPSYFFTNGLTALRYWLEHAVKHHKCELVSEANPAGIDPNWNRR